MTFSKFSRDVEWSIRTIRSVLDLHLDNPDGWPLQWVFDQFDARRKILNACIESQESMEKRIIQGVGGNSVASHGIFADVTWHSLAIRLSKEILESVRLASPNGEEISFTLDERDLKFPVIIAGIKRERMILTECSPQRTLTDRVNLMKSHLTPTETELIEHIQDLKTHQRSRMPGTSDDSIRKAASKLGDKLFQHSEFGLELLVNGSNYRLIDLFSENGTS